MKLGVTLDILNQKDTPAFYADTLANRPAAGFTGRVFISTDTLDLYRDTGTTWVLLSPSSTGTITGSGAAGQVTYFSGASSITGSNNLFWNSVNNRLGINTNTPGASLDIHGSVNAIAHINQTTTTNDTRLVFLNSGTGLWRIGNIYNGGANDYGIFDVVGGIEPFSIKKTTGQTFIGAQTTTSGRLVVNDATGDNHIVVIGATAPSLRINNAGTGATRQIGIGLATTTNNFIQGTTGGELCIFNASTTSSPILLGIWNGTNNQEGARLSTSYNWLIGSVVDSGERLQVTGTAKITSTLTANSLVKSGGTSAQILAADGSVITAGTGITIGSGTISASSGAAAGTNIGLIPNGSYAGSILFYLNNPYYWNGYYSSAGSVNPIKILNQSNYNASYLSPISTPLNFGNNSGVINSGGNFGTIPFVSGSSSSQANQDATIINLTTSAFSTFTNVEYPEQAITSVRNYLANNTTENTLFTNNVLGATIMLSFLRKGNSGGFCWYLFNGSLSGTRYYDTSKTTASTSMQCFDLPLIARFNGNNVYSFFDRTAFGYIYTTNGTSYTSVSGISMQTFPQITSQQYNLGSGNCLDCYQTSSFGTSWYYSTNGGQSYSMYNLPIAAPTFNSQAYYHCIDYNGNTGSPKWAYCGSNGTLYYSTNLSTGFTASATTGVGSRNIFYVNGYFFALPYSASSTTIYYSTDAITWSSLTVPNGVYSYVTYSAASLQYFFITGNNSTNTAYCSSTFTGATNIASTTGNSNSFATPYSYAVAIWKNGDQFAYIDSSGSIRYYTGTGTTLSTITSTAAARTTGSPAQAVPNAVQFLYQKMN
jgi:hypothetical protein